MPLCFTVRLPEGTRQVHDLKLWHESGLNFSTAYTLNDYYGKRIEECKTTADTNNLGNEFLDDYVRRQQLYPAEKTEEAKLLLSGTHMSISEISDELSFTH